jgi:hypothetical protein
MKILAIDPGNTESAYVIWDGVKIHTAAKVANAEMRCVLRDYIVSDQGVRTEVKCVAVEMIASYGMAVGKSVFETCVEIGRLVQICHDRSVTPTLVFRMEVKQGICHSSKANDSNIRTALMDRFGVKGTKKSPGFFYGFHADVWAAFAVAVVVVDRNVKQLLEKI